MVLGQDHACCPPPEQQEEGRGRRVVVGLVAAVGRRIVLLGVGRVVHVLSAVADPQHGGCGGEAAEARLQQAWERVGRAVPAQAHLRRLVHMRTADEQRRQRRRRLVAGRVDSCGGGGAIGELPGSHRVGAEQQQAGAVALVRLTSSLAGQTSSRVVSQSVHLSSPPPYHAGARLVCAPRSPRYTWS